MLGKTEYRKILSLYEKENSVRKVRKLLGYSRNTIRKVIKEQTPPPFNTPQRASILDGYKDYIRKRFDKTRLSAPKIYEEIVPMGYVGSISTIKNFIRTLKSKNGRGNGIACEFSLHHQRRVDCHIWMHRLLQGKITIWDLEVNISLDNNDIQVLYNWIRNKPKKYRNRAMAVLAYYNRFPQSTISNFLGIHRRSVHSYIVRFSSGGIHALFDKRRKGVKKFEEAAFKDAVFKVLHTPPSTYGINRTTWRMEDLIRILKQEGFQICKPYIRKITKDAGYQYLKAKKVLTSNDPLYREKLQEIKRILSNLQSKEKFFSIDEFGPFSIKMQGGRSLVHPEERKIIPQYQKSKGSLIVTAALELSTNQVAYFYSQKKNTDEMLKLLKILMEQYKDEDCIYLSWDAASWHASKKFYKKIEEVNSAEYLNMHMSPSVKLAPLPAGAQFLNVIESVFSGMSRAIIHNSDYPSVEEARKAIDRYFAERNQFFKDNPKRAGKKIWGKERTQAKFSESNNCKDPRYM